MTPNEYFKEHCYTEPIDPRELDMLLLEPVSRKVTKEGINYEGKKFWHSSLATIVGEYILLRADTRFDVPDEIEVFHKDRWLCTAFTPTSKRGRRVTRKEVGDAQRAQRESARKEFHASEQLIAEVDEEIQATTSAKNQTMTPAKDQSEPLKENCPSTEKRPPADKPKNQSNKQSSRSLANDYMQTLIANDTDWKEAV